jgi:hypothetical protein
MSSSPATRRSTGGCATPDPAERAGNKHLAGTGAGALRYFKQAAPNFLKLAEETVTDKRLKIERGQTKRGYLHLRPRTLGADLHAGLFTKKAEE